MYPLYANMSETQVKFTREEILHLARLARIELSEADIVRYEHDLPAIVEYFGVLQSVDPALLSSIAENTDQMLLRPDTITPSDATREELLASSSRRIIDHQIVIGRVL